MIIFFAGPDCCGKNLLMHTLAQDYSYSIFMSPRSHICNIVYDRIYDRNRMFEATNFETIHKLLKMNSFFILIEVKPELLVKRALKRKEKHVNDIDVFKKHIRVYNKVFKECKEKFPEYEHRFIKISNNSEDIYITARKLRSKIDSNLVIDIIESNKKTLC
jgi:thymidylate kinase